MRVNGNIDGKTELINRQSGSLIKFFMDQNKGDQVESILEKNEILQMPQQVYVATVPTEPASKNPGRMEGIVSLVCAVMSFLFSPVIFGITGIVFGISARRKGSAVLGAIGIIFSIVFMILGIAAVIWTALSEEVTLGIIKGAALIVFK